VLGAGNGAVVWSRNAASDTGMQVPYWGFASSPLVIGNIRVVCNAREMAAFRLSLTGR
jgi:hypothetical protein